ncbi:MAG TPA: XRE family transcriptional regulator [Rhodobacteraceae bacterium]|jgi:transcriptional regulator with XRE-family HTH domain|nr:XRE family transcriptional regulator [Paracoccaceae bacterium]
MPHIVDLHVGKRAKEIRTIRGLTQSNVADMLGISFQQLQKYETGANRISASRMFEISKLLGVSPSYFFEGLEGEDYTSMPPIDIETARIANLLSNIKNEKLKKRLYTLISEIASGGADDLSALKL